MNGSTISKPPDSPFESVRDLFQSPSTLSSAAVAILLSQLVKEINERHISLFDSEDIPCWSGSTNGVFSLASTRALVQIPRPSSMTSKFIWHKLLP